MKKCVGFRKKIFLSSLLLFAFMLSFSMISATLSLAYPASNSNFTSTSLTCNFANVTDIDTPLNANSSFQQNGVAISVTSFACNATACTASASASALTDGLAQTLSCRLGNMTNVLGSQTNKTGIGIYTSTPSCTNALDRLSVKYEDMLGINPADYSSKDALTSLTYNWTLFGPGTVVKASSTSEIPNFANGNFDELGEFLVAEVITDTFANTAACTNVSLFVTGTEDASEPVKKAVEEATTKKATSNGLLWIIIGAIFIVIFICAAWWVISASKRN